MHVSELFFSSTRITMRKKFTEKMNIQNVIAIIIIIYGIVFGTLSMHFQQQKKKWKKFLPLPPKKILSFEYEWNGWKKVIHRELTDSWNKKKYQISNKKKMKKWNVLFPNFIFVHLVRWWSVVVVVFNVFSILRRPVCACVVIYSN